MLFAARGAAASFLSFLLLAACSRETHASRPPVIVIGVDGMEWSVAEALLAEGRMPHLQRLLDEGVGGELQTLIPTFSPSLWTSIATGRMPQDHGIPFFSEWDWEKQMPVKRGLPYTSECRRVPAIWNLAGDAGREVLSVGWWVSWPAETVPHGRIVASYAAQGQGDLLWKPGVWKDGLPELTAPAALEAQIAPMLQDGAPDGPYAAAQLARYGRSPLEWSAADNPYGNERQREVSLRSTWVGDRTHQQIFLDQLERGVADLNLVYFGSLDVVGHMLWRYHQPEPFRYPLARERLDFFGQHVRKAYEDVDAWIGEILAQLPEERVVMLVSDHGMSAYQLNNPAVLQSGHHQNGDPGCFVLSGAGVARRGLLPRGERRLGTILDVAPTLCDLVGIPALSEMRGGDGRANPSLRSLMTPEWQAAQPLAKRVPSPRFRAPQPPREPVAGASDLFNQTFAALGYTGVGGAEPPPGSGEPQR